MVIPSEPVRDIMRRTMANLDFIEKNAQPDGPFEVTQLINSFLGALAHPWEALQADLLALPLAEAAQRGCPQQPLGRFRRAGPRGERGRCQD